MTVLGDLAKFCAREFVARWSRETGEAQPRDVTDLMLFAYEVGCLRGQGDGMRRAEGALRRGDGGAPAHDQAGSLAREFVDRWSRETGEELTAVAADRATLSYEMGYRRGLAEGTAAFAVALHDKLNEKVDDADAKHE